MRHLLKQLSFMLSAIFVVSCASSVPPARIGDYVSSEHQVGEEALSRIDQRPLQAGLIVVSDTADPGAAPNLPEEALIRLVEKLQQDIGRCDSCIDKRDNPRRPYQAAAAWGLGSVRRIGPTTGGSTIWQSWLSPAPSKNIP